MKKTDPNLDEYLLMTVLAELFDNSDSIDLDLLSTKITNGLERNGLLKFEEDEDHTFEDIAAA